MKREQAPLLEMDTSLYKRSRTPLNQLRPEKVPREIDPCSGQNYQELKKYITNYSKKMYIKPKPGERTQKMDFDFKMFQDQVINSQINKKVLNPKEIRRVLKENRNHRGGLGEIEEVQYRSRTIKPKNQTISHPIQDNQDLIDDMNENINQNHFNRKRQTAILPG